MSGSKPDEILNTLQRAGYEAYYVGGCVRDHLLGRPIHDCDIATSALPEQTMACFDHCVPTGIRHGTVTVLLEQYQAEVTTFRSDGTYGDSRHPDRVEFVRTLQEDLARRDFTINAMAMTQDHVVTDLYGGREDLERRCLRCVGDPDQRFQEDALRMLRAVRFSAQLDFEIEENTRQAMERRAGLCETLSMERIRDEMEKTLLSDHPERLQDMARLGLLNCCSPDKEQECHWLGKLPPVREIRWAGLCRLWPELDLVRLRLDKRTAQNAMKAGRSAFPETRLDWKRRIVREGRDCVLLSAALCGKYDEIREMLRSGECISLRELAVNGADFPELHGPQVGEILHMLLDHVLAYPQDNVREKLFQIYKN